MCVLIDTSSFSMVFSTSNKNHHKYKPVLDWIINGKGSVVYGGTKYFEEIGIQKMKLLNILKDAGKAVVIDRNRIDDRVQLVLDIIPFDEDFDDPHLIAILQISKCKLICTDDKRLDPYIKDQRLFESMKNRPRIYRDKRNKNLLCDQYIADCCSKSKIKKSQIDSIVKHFNV